MLKLNLSLGNKKPISDRHYLVTVADGYYVYIYNSDDQWYDPITLDCYDEPESWALLPILTPAKITHS